MCSYTGSCCGSKLWGNCAEPMAGGGQGWPVTCSIEGCSWDSSMFAWCASALLAWWCAVFLQQPVTQQQIHPTIPATRHSKITTPIAVAAVPEMVPACHATLSAESSGGIRLLIASMAIRMTGAHTHCRLGGPTQKCARPVRFTPSVSSESPAMSAAWVPWRA